MIHLVVFLLALALSLGLTPLIIRLLLQSRIMDIPNRRSSHAVPVPRGGGFGILLPLAIILALLLVVGKVKLDAFTVAILVGLAGMTLIGFLDDLFSLPALTRLVFEGVLMAFCLFFASIPLSEIALPLLPPVTTGAVGWVLAWLFLVGFPNFFNFMDGINGLAGSQTLIGCTALAVLGYQAGFESLSILAATIAGGALGFLRFNVPVAKVFLGDSGSLPIGFFLAAASLAVSVKGTGNPFVVPALLLWVILFDAGLTLLMRSCRGRRLHHAHQEHLYQRLVLMGFPHTRVTLIYTAAMLGVVLAAFLYRDGDDSARLVILAAVAGSSIMFAGFVLNRFRRHLRQQAAGLEHDG